MHRSSFYVAIALAVGSAGACRTSPSAGHAPPVIRPGAPGQQSTVVTGAGRQDVPQATAADVKFMQGMIHHHAQALDMVDLLEKNSNDADMKKLGLKIHVSQTDEIKMMQRWLQSRGQEAPDPRAHHMADMPGMEGMDHDVMMPGMLTKAEMARLAAAKGAEFDRLFLEGMIKHHSGALTMVADLFATAGAAQGSEIFAFASDVDADQRMEIDRMSAMLKELQK